MIAASNCQDQNEGDIPWSDASKHPENGIRGTRLSGAIIGATVLTAALIGTSALVVVVTTSPSTSQTAVIASSAVAASANKPLTPSSPS